MNPSNVLTIGDVSVLLMLWSIINIFICLSVCKPCNLKNPLVQANWLKTRMFCYAYKVSRVLQQSYIFLQLVSCLITLSAAQAFSFSVHNLAILTYAPWKRQQLIRIIKFTWYAGTFGHIKCWLEVDERWPFFNLHECTDGVKLIIDANRHKWMPLILIPSVQCLTTCSFY